MSADTPRRPDDYPYLWVDYCIEAAHNGGVGLVIPIDYKDLQEATRKRRHFRAMLRGREVFPLSRLAQGTKGVWFTLGLVETPSGAVRIHIQARWDGLKAIEKIY